MIILGWCLVKGERETRGKKGGEGEEEKESNKMQVRGISPQGNVIKGDNIKIRNVILIISSKRLIRMSG